MNPTLRPERRGLEVATVGDDKANIPRVADALEWIAIHYQYVRPHARLQGAAFLLQPHGPGGNDGRGLDRLHGREPGLHVELHLAVDAVPRHGEVGAGDDGDAGPVQRPDDLEHASGTGRGAFAVSAGAAPVWVSAWRSSGATLSTPGSKALTGWSAGCALSSYSAIVGSTTMWCSTRKAMAFCASGESMVRGVESPRARIIW